MERRPRRLPRRPRRWLRQPRLIAFTRTLRDSSELYRQLSGTAVEGSRDVSAEHRELMDLATSRKADEAVESLRRHLQRTTDTLLASVLAEPAEAAASAR
ncbi:FCD domain-containing protein [Pseudarthrobacter psychrotolerans]|uniref:FCD domain-containing protein n=1 Tax=Pseudarthrobacter psychrotolerans TaxID=2697569 RepID=A0A6P1NPT1_9MICC|nr:FCD domain-containing protein [Pseudarthrobacter psychrotolerans]QHK21083.1 FCD domain-containing protein [Pseudarthrobacter psychrotolerans]